MCRAATIDQICDEATGDYRDPTEPAQLATLGIEGFEATEHSYDCVDNDCDGVVDEASTDADRARVTPSETWTRGVCGVTSISKSCVAGQLEEPSAVEVAEVLGAGSGGVFEYPTEASADCYDNDCDGEVDEGLERSCYGGDEIGEDDVEFGLSSRCRRGTVTCTGEGVGRCDGWVAPIDEVCHNQLDDDCDGTIDEGCLGGPCVFDSDCPQGLTSEGNAVDVTCSTGFPGGLCVMQCDCTDCRVCRFNRPGDPACDPLCEQCDIDAAICASFRGLCGTVVNPVSDERLYPCLPDCGIEDVACREGYTCEDRQIAGRDVQICL